MKKLIFHVSGVIVTNFIFLALGFAQANPQSPNFGGKWILNEKESFSGNTSEKVYDEYSITISENGPQFTIEIKIVQKKKEQLRKAVYFTDERGEVNLFPSKNAKDIEVRSKTFRKGNSVKGRYEYEVIHAKTRQLGNYTGTYEYALKDNGKTLIWIRTHLDEVLNTASSSGQTYSSRGRSRWVFDRASN